MSLFPVAFPLCPPLWYYVIADQKPSNILEKTDLKIRHFTKVTPINDVTKKGPMVHPQQGCQPPAGGQPSGFLTIRPSGFGLTVKSDLGLGISSISKVYLPLLITLCINLKICLTKWPKLSYWSQNKIFYYFNLRRLFYEVQLPRFYNATWRNLVLQ